MPQKIVVLGTGGTIAGTAAAPGDHLGYTAAQLGVEALVAAVPALAGVPLACEQVAQLDSKDMDFTTWQQLVLRCRHWLDQPDVQGLVITHGTDTLEETAFLLHRVLAPAKPVVLTCAMRPATALMADGPQNLLDAVTVARAPGATGVVAVCAGVVHAAPDVSKQHSYRLDAFTSGEAGPAGLVEEGRLRLLRDWPAAGAKEGPAAMNLIAAAQAWPRVEIVFNHAGADGGIVRALLAHGVDGIVAAGTGNGTLSRGLEAALLQAQERGVRVLRATRCVFGRVLPHGGDVLPHAEGLSPVKARIELLLRLLAERA
ncbi:asparaginase [Ramlibacter tataouinensis]|uniref:L-asparaginase (L-asparagine amidohydrolase)-like protein n=1 Tax=Ramlibacter tataouinensis (strain ATCC BAA-407 / DSM 14655 / LMG 21543 / TTB310) TaxID=365046 RepID=F5XZT3_RAMTT|nr:L-asparaginase (L-asparagine amidohydrolase)-like protein [Ramlibacter tataouinensis TTB310]